MGNEGHKFANFLSHAHTGCFLALPTHVFLIHHFQPIFTSWRICPEQVFLLNVIFYNDVEIRVAWIWALLLNKAKHPQITSHQRNPPYYSFNSPNIDFSSPIKGRYMSNNVYQNILDVNEDNNIGCVDVLSVSGVGFSDVMLFVDISFSCFIQK